MIADKLYKWVDRKILTIEFWVNSRVASERYVDIDLDRVPKARNKSLMEHTRENSLDKLAVPMTANLEGATVRQHMYGAEETECFAQLELDGETWWRHRYGGVTEDYPGILFDSMRSFFEHQRLGDNDYWVTVLRSKARKDGAQDAE